MFCQVAVPADELQSEVDEVGIMLASEMTGNVAISAWQSWCACGLCCAARSWLKGMSKVQQDAHLPLEPFEATLS
jgi:hypothetical protein